jgi:hypothetical protein
MPRFTLLSAPKEEMERETGLEPATSSLGSWHSTTELLPLLNSRQHHNITTRDQIGPLIWRLQGRLLAAITRASIAMRLTSAPARNPAE